MLKTTGSLDLALRLGANNVEDVWGDGKADDKNLSKSQKSKNAKSGKHMRIGATGKPTFLTPSTRKAFN